MEDNEEFILSEEAAEWLGQKKSEYLSKLIEHYPPNDYGFEEYHKFDHLISQTIETPDHVYELKSDYPIRTFIKSYAEKESFHQLVIGAIFPDTRKNGEVFVPILTMVTKFRELAQVMEQGTPSRGSLLN